MAVCVYKDDDYTDADDVDDVVVGLKTFTKNLHNKPSSTKVKDEFHELAGNTCKY